jgi:hypothetical protein
VSNGLNVLSWEDVRMLSHLGSSDHFLENAITESAVAKKETVLAKRLSPRISILRSTVRVTG